MPHVIVKLWPGKSEQLSPKARNDARYSQRGKEGIVSIEEDLEETDREARPLKTVLSAAG